MTPRKHAELIKAWADGAEIEHRVWAHMGNVADWYWIDDPNPTWADDEVYRRKSVPKEDEIHRGFVHFASVGIKAVPVVVTFDGETGEPKTAEIVK